MARQENDLYPTPEPLALSICARVHKHYPSFPAVVEPSIGAGVFIKPINHYWPGAPAIGVDINPSSNSLMSRSDIKIARVFEGDWVEVLKQWKLDQKILVIGNPPFSLAEPHIVACLDYLVPGSVVAFLLKLNFFGGLRRVREFWAQRQLRFLVPIAGRPSFVKGEKASNDTNEYGAFIWEVGYEGPTVIDFPHIHWKHQSQGEANDVREHQEGH